MGQDWWSTVASPFNLFPQTAIVEFLLIKEYPHNKFSFKAGNLALKGNL
jgi:hypothetical protein